MATAAKRNASDNDEGAALDAARADLADQIAVLRKDIDALAGALKTLTRTGVDAAAAGAAKRAKAAGEAGAEAAESALDAVARNGERVSGYAREKPFQALAIAAAAGLLLGYLTASRR